MPATIVRLILAALLLSPVALAQSFEVSPQAIIVNPAPGFGVEVWLDRDRTGSATPTYQVGDEISIGVRVDEESYVYLFDIRPNGEVTQIFPNRFDGNNRLRAGETRTFPPAGARYVFNIAPPRGLSKVVAVASTSELNTSQLASFQREADFASSSIGEQGFIQNFAIIVRPIPQQSWVTDTALYHVGAQPPRQAQLPQPTVAPLNAYLRLTPYPGSTVTRQRNDGRDSKSTFTSSARLRDVYEHLHQQLVRDGWRRTELDRDDNEIEAEYRRDRLKFELELKAKSRDRFELEIDFD
jgi:hypothetical protein